MIYNEQKYKSLLHEVKELRKLLQDRKAIFIRPQEDGNEEDNQYFMGKASECVFVIQKLNHIIQNQ